jgi:hypothetical protein
MSDSVLLTEELSVGPARLRVDIIGPYVPAHVLADTDFLDYRLAQVRVEADLVLDNADVVLEQVGDTSVHYDGHTVRLIGEWGPGPLQKIVVALLALRLEEHGLHPFHSSAARYRGRTVMFLGGESNHGKSMCQIEACRRGAALVSTETTIVDEAGTVVMGSTDVFLKKRVAGTERADKAAPDVGVAKFFGELPSWDIHRAPSTVDVVVVPAIDGNYATSLHEMIPFERQFQTLHSLQNYFLLNELLAEGWPMPIVDTEPLRLRRAQFAAKFCRRPFYFARAATPQLLMDEVEAVL